MDVVIEGAVSIRVVANDEELRFRGAGVDFHAPWQAITGAGLARLREIDLAAGGPQLLTILPGMERLNAASVHLARGNRLLMIGRARGRGRPRAFTVALPLEDPNALLLIAELKKRLGARWLGEDDDQRTLKRGLGASYPFWYWPVGLLFVLCLTAVTLLAVGAWALLDDPEGHGELTDARWYSFAALAAWLGLCAVLFFLARRVLGDDHAWRYAVPIPFVLLLAVLTPPAVATFRLLEDGRVSELEPVPVLALVIWLVLVLLAARFIRRLLDAATSSSRKRS